MYLSDHDLKQFAPHNLPPEKLARLLTEKVVEVEGLHRWDLENIVVGEAKEIKPHPNADRLRLIEISIGTKNLTIVCGGKNLYVGQRVPVALVGAMFQPHGKGDKLKLESATIRGIKSEGMICAASELDLPINDRHPGPDQDPTDSGQARMTTDENEGPFILDLTRFIPNAKAGTPLAKALGFDDVRYEIDNKSLARRADLWGYWGMSREVAAITGTKQKPLSLVALPWSAKRRRITIQDKKGCLQSAAVEIENIVVGESPWEVKRRLMAAGMNSVNIIVDLTNIVMLETGQPMHAFDRNRVPKIVIRKATNGESIRVLNGREYTLTPLDCVITDGKDPVDIAGIIGGDNTGVSPGTTAIALTLCSFEPVMIRKTSQRLQLRTEASARFEKGQAVEMVDIAARRFFWYLKKYQPHARLVICERQGQTTTPKRSVRLDWQRLDALIGTGVVSLRAAKKILSQLGCTIKGSGKILTVTVPFWRNDLETMADIAEEVARLHGFNQIPVHLPKLEIVPPYRDAGRELTEWIRSFLVERAGLDETESYPFETPLGLKDECARIEVVSPIAQDSKWLRTDLGYNVLTAVASNLRYYNSVRLFEIGKVFLSGTSSQYPRGGKGKDMLPSQPTHCVAAIAGEEKGFLAMKGIVESLMQSAGWHPTMRPGSQRNLLDSEQSIDIVVDDQVVGSMGLVSKPILSRWDIKKLVVLLDLSVDKLFLPPRSAVAYRTVSPYPGVYRDIAILVDAQQPYAAVAAVLGSATEHLKSFELFDQYSGKGLPDGKKSLAFHLIFSDPARTLTNQEVDASMEKLMKILERGVHATIRK